MKITANVNRVSESFTLTKESGMAISANKTGTIVRTVLPRISCLLISGFWMCSEYMTYRRIQYRHRPISIICVPNIMTESSFSLNWPRMLAEKGTRLINMRKIAFIFINFESTFFAYTEIKK